MGAPTDAWNGAEAAGWGSRGGEGAPWGLVWARLKAAVSGGALKRARAAEESGAWWPLDGGGRPVAAGGGGVGRGESGEAEPVGCPAIKESTAAAHHGRMRGDEPVKDGGR